ncbi:MAG TPA: hypothetical protein VFU69_05695 [Ktedonobacterales bacterium]|nr:hypothetical protein [Ktedonobacterales bacterium]
MGAALPIRVVFFAFLQGAANVAGGTLRHPTLATFSRQAPSRDF